MNEIYEDLEQTNVLEGNGELLENLKEFQEQYEEAKSQGFEDAAKYYESKIEELQEALSENVQLGSGHSEGYWLDRAAEEYAKHGESSRYESYMKKAGEAHAEKQVKG